MSPSEVYPPVCDYEWMEAHGYTALRRSGGEKKRYALSLGDSRYRSETAAQLQRLIRENNLGHIKYDGFVAEEPAGHHGMLPGADSVEPLAEASLELLRASKEANPALVTEPTYMNSLANYISPWILKYSDSIWGNSGGDCPLGLGPAPDYRESHTNAREYYIFSSLDEFWLPQNAVHYFDIIHCDEAGGFANHAAMAFGRGRFFVSTYVNPKFMTASDWTVYAGFLRWARKNQELLRNTTVVPSRVERGEPYAYAHWQGMRGVVAVRNPSNETREYHLELARTRPPAGLRDAVCVTLYPHSRGVAAGIHARSVLSLTLAPWELQILELRPVAEMQGPVVLGGRWIRNGNTTRLAHDGIASDVESLTPEGIRRSLAIPLRSPTPPAGRVLRRSAWQMPEVEWLTGKAGHVPSVAFEFDCEVDVPVSCASAEVLVLVQVEGRQFYPSRCQATVNGQAAVLGESNSAGHIGYYDSHPQWARSRETDRQWTWYRCQVPAGHAEIRVRGAAAGPDPQVGVWAWGDEDLEKSARENSLLLPLPELPQLDPGRQRVGRCLQQPAKLL
ncbi:MAG: hypothetical protein NTY38_10890 [Acidobacteria bacterium]|nr:hypothetical protein [Acidobacteriota bacterium]